MGFRSAQQEAVVTMLKRLGLSEDDITELNEIGNHLRDKLNAKALYEEVVDNSDEYSDECDCDCDCEENATTVELLELVIHNLLVDLADGTIGIENGQELLATAQAVEVLESLKYNAGN